MGKLLLAENDRALAGLLRTRLQLSGWSVDTVDDGQAAIEAVRTRRPDVILLDLRLSGLDGLDVLQELSLLPERPPVVLMSGFVDLENTLAAIRSGVTEVLKKPVAPEHLCAVLDDVTSRSNSVRREANSSAEAMLVPELVGDAPPLRRLRMQILSVVPFHNLPVLISGETGTGKEIVAHAVHRLANQSRPFVAVNCAAMPESLFESELFGHAAGSFTGAGSSRSGLLDAAASGTLFLDEVGELTPPLQAKLLRVLESRRYRPVGSNREVKLEARIISASNRDLAATPQGVFRRDLFYRLAGYVIETPPLRERMEDIPSLVGHFLSEHAKSHPQDAREISDQALYALQAHGWPGNVRELRAVVLSALVRAGQQIGVRHVVQAMGGRVAPASAVADVTGASHGLPQLEREFVSRAFEECEGNLSRAARRLQIPRTTLRDKIKRYGLR